MSGLIERDKIVFQKVTCPIYAFNGKTVENRNLGIYASKEQIDALPDVECEPVRHAHWEKECRSQITFPDGEVATLIERKCSNCHTWSDKEILKYYPTPAERCSKCGAKMDGLERSVDILDASDSRVVRHTWIDTLAVGRIYELMCYPVKELVKDPDMIQKGKLETVDHRKTKYPDQVYFINGIPRTVYDRYVEGVTAEYCGTGFFITQDSPAYCVDAEFICACKIAYEKENEK